MTKQINGSHAARTSRPAYLAVAPEPGTAAVDDTTPAVSRLETIFALADAVNARTRALANLDRIDSMDLDELDALAELVNGLAYIKRHTRPNLRLADEADLDRIVETALAEARTDDDALAMVLPFTASAVAQ